MDCFGLVVLVCEMLVVGWIVWDFIYTSKQSEKYMDKIQDKE